MIYLESSVYRSQEEVFPPPDLGSERIHLFFLRVPWKLP
ncbi:MAG: hypothetical protein H6Q42_599 [Deltaproteobacteria bacterium]|nr:hypothetical protein [Deltaproteobacteria bacterium]